MLISTEEFEKQLEIEPLKEEIKKLRSDNKYLIKKMSEMEQCSTICGIFVCMIKVTICAFALVGWILLCKLHH